jgi:predicted nucleotidyltransferase component of viral defense system
MPTPERGTTPAGFRRQVLQLIRNEASRTGIPAQRHQQRIAFERLLDRLPRDGDWILKGGLALQFRYGLLSRSTKDVDLRIAMDSTIGLNRLRELVATATNDDNFSFELGEIAQELQGAPGGTLRVKVVARLAGLQFTAFHVDLSSGDALVDDPDRLTGSEFLAFAGIAPVEFPVYPITQHLAEKLHAYTLPREQDNTRVKDLVDLVLFAATEPVEANRLDRCVTATFKVRATHPLPGLLPSPPAAWAGTFKNIAREASNIPTVDVWEGHALAASLWDPFLARRVADRWWTPQSRAWTAAREMG